MLGKWRGNLPTFSFSLLPSFMMEKKKVRHQKQKERMDWNLALSRDLMIHSQPVVSGGFDVGKRSTTFGFSIGKSILSSLSSGMESIPLVPTVLSGVHSVLTFAESSTIHVLNASNQIVISSLSTGNSLLESCGAGQNVLTMQQPRLYAAQCITNLLLQYFKEMDGVSFSDLVTGLSRLHVLQEKEAEEVSCCCDTSMASTKLSLPVDVIKQLMQCSAASYGDVILRMLGMLNLEETVNQRYLNTVDVLAQEVNGDVYNPGWLLGRDRISNCYILAIRGTSRVHDAATDLMCASQQVFEFDAKDGDFDGSFVHHGMWTAALKLHETMSRLLPIGASVFLTGHSLGAGVASLLYLQSKNQPQYHIQACVCFAPPSSMSLGLSNVLRKDDRFLSVVVSADVVPRLSLHSMNVLRNRAMALAACPTLTLAELRQREQQDIMNRQRLLFPPGRVLHLFHEEEEEVRCEYPESDAFAEVILSPGMFSHHLPNVYMDTIDRVSKMVTI